MSLLKRNFISNLIGTNAIALVQLVVTPVYLNYLGKEAFGLIGVFITLSNIAILLDMGLSSASSREIARLTASEHTLVEVRSTVRTLELIYYVVATLFILITIPLVSLFATDWLNIELLPTKEVIYAVELMLIQLAFQFPLAFCGSGFIGLQRQVLFNIINTTLVSIKLIGAVFVIQYSNHKIIDFFIWQLGITILQFLVIRTVLWYILPAGKAKFQIEILKRLWQYASTQYIATLLSVCLSQVDKVILSRLLSLSDFGFYMIAWSLASSLNRLASPVATAWLPSLTQLATKKDYKKLANIYITSAKLTSILILSSGIIMAAYPSKVIFIYLGEIAYPKELPYVLSILAVSFILNGLVNTSQTLALAIGKPIFLVWQNAVGVFITLPLCIYFSEYYGLLGGGVSWLIANLISFIFFTPKIHEAVLKEINTAFFLRTIFPIIFICVTCLFILSLLYSSEETRPVEFLVLAAKFIICVLASFYYFRIK